MYSGKSTELIRRISRAQLARRSVRLFKAAIDTRYDPKKVVSHDQQSLTCIPIGNATDMIRHIDADTQVVGIDEVQFLGSATMPVVKKLMDAGKRVIVAGLDLDSNEMPFEPLPELLALADSVTKLTAVCVICGEAATRTQRTSNNKDRILVGAADAYEARCRACFSVDPEFRRAPLRVVD